MRVDSSKRPGLHRVYGLHVNRQGGSTLDGTDFGGFKEK